MRATAIASGVSLTTAMINLYCNCLLTFLSLVLDYKLLESRNCILLISTDSSITVVLRFEEKKQSLGKRREFEIELSIGHDGGLSSG